LCQKTIFRANINCIGFDIGAIFYIEEDLKLNQNMKFTRVIAVCRVEIYTSIKFKFGYTDITKVALYRYELKAIFMFDII